MRVLPVRDSVTLHDICKPCAGLFAGGGGGGVDLRALTGEHPQAHAAGIELSVSVSGHLAAAWLPLQVFLLEARGSRHCRRNHRTGGKLEDRAALIRGKRPLPRATDGDRFSV